jgi:hypothetical protein
MRAHVVQTNSRIGDHGVERGHQVGLRDRRKLVKRSIEQALVMTRIERAVFVRVLARAAERVRLMRFELFA